MPFAERHPQSTYLPPRPVGYVPVAGGRGPTAWHCLSCGKRNLSVSRFCGGCAAPSRLPAEFLESLEPKAQEAAKPETVVPAPPAGVISSVATFTTISVIQQFDPPEPRKIERAAPARKTAAGNARPPAPIAAVPVTPAPVPTPAPVQAPAATSMQAAIASTEPAPRADVPEVASGKASKRRRPSHLRRAKKAVVRAFRSARTALAGFVLLAARGILQHASAHRSLAVGAVSIVILCGLWPFPSLTAAKNWNTQAMESGKPVFWNDMQTYISKKLGLGIADTELLARAAWGDIPSLHLPMTCERALAIESVINQRGSRPLVVFPNIPFRGALLDRHLQLVASEPAPFSDVPLDHPLYEAWRSLLALTPPAPVALPNGKACPYEVIRWEEWQPLVAAAWRSRRPGRTPPEELLMERSGTLSSEDADRSIRVLGEGLEVDIGETVFKANPQTAPSRMEILAALSRVLAAAQNLEDDGV